MLKYYVLSKTFTINLTTYSSWLKVDIVRNYIVLTQTLEISNLYNNVTFTSFSYLENIVIFIKYVALIHNLCDVNSWKWSKGPTLGVADAAWASCILFLSGSASDPASCCCALEEAAGIAQGLGAFHSLERSRWSFWILGLIWPSADCSRRLGKRIGGWKIFVSLCFLNT